MKTQCQNGEQGFQRGNTAGLKGKWKTTQREGSVDPKQRGAPPACRRSGTTGSRGEGCAERIAGVWGTLSCLKPPDPPFLLSNLSPACTPSSASVQSRYCPQLCLGPRPSQGQTTNHRSRAFGPSAFLCAGSRARLLEVEFKPRPGSHRNQSDPEYG